MDNQRAFGAFAFSSVIPTFMVQNYKKIVGRHILHDCWVAVLDVRDGGHVHQGDQGEQALLPLQMVSHSSDTFPMRLRLLPYFKASQKNCMLEKEQNLQKKL
jgi:hypothetical protein